MDFKNCGEEGLDGTLPGSSLANLQSRADYSNEVPMNSNRLIALNFNSTLPFDSKSANYRPESQFADFVAPVTFGSIFGTQMWHFSDSQRN